MASKQDTKNEDSLNLSSLQNALFNFSSASGDSTFKDTVSSSIANLSSLTNPVDLYSSMAASAGLLPNSALFPLHNPLLNPFTAPYLQAAQLNLAGTLSNLSQLMPPLNVDVDQKEKSFNDLLANSRSSSKPKGIFGAKSNQTESEKLLNSSNFSFPGDKTLTDSGFSDAPFLEDPGVVNARLSSSMNDDLLSLSKNSLDSNSKWRTEFDNYPKDALFRFDANDAESIDRCAKLYRSAAAIMDASCTWSGILTSHHCKNPVYSCKVFLGGVPWDITEQQLQEAFRQYGHVEVAGPNRRDEKILNNSNSSPRSSGYCYVLFENEKSVKQLLQDCDKDKHSSGTWQSDHEYFYRISSKRMRSKEVQVIPWILSDSCYWRQPQQKSDSSRTVFVGALHGMITAEALCTIMNDLFGNVISAQIDTDKYKYPIGSGRVSFSNHKSYQKAIAAAFVEIKTPKFAKKIQIDPFLEEKCCSHCTKSLGPYYCRSCMLYFCRNCFWWQHHPDQYRDHKPLMRNTSTKGLSTICATDPLFS